MLSVVAAAFALATNNLAARAAASRATVQTKPTFGSGTLGAIKEIDCDSTTCRITAYTANTSASAPALVAVRLSFHSPTVVRWWAQLDGNWSDDGAAADVLVGHRTPVALADAIDHGDYVEVQPKVGPTGEPPVIARVYKSACTLSLMVGDALVMSETVPLSWDVHAMWQTTARDLAPPPVGLTKEWFYGGGMQNARWSHRDATITIAADYNWARGGHPNPAPWCAAAPTPARSSAGSKRGSRPAPC